MRLCVLAIGVAQIMLRTRSVIDLSRSSVAAVAERRGGLGLFDDVQIRATGALIKYMASVQLPGAINMGEQQLLS